MPLLTHTEASPLQPASRPERIGLWPRRGSQLRFTDCNPKPVCAGLVHDPLHCGVFFPRLHIMADLAGPVIRGVVQEDLVPAVGLPLGHHAYVETGLVHVENCSGREGDGANQELFGIPNTSMAEAVEERVVVDQPLAGQVDVLGIQLAAHGGAAHTQRR